MYEPEWRRPASKDEALSVLSELGEDAALVAGGTDLTPLVSSRELRPVVLVDLCRADDLRRVSVADGRVEIGALATHGELARGGSVVPEVLSNACRTVGAPQVRARGTIGGNLANASPAADGSVALMALGATAVVESLAGGRREVPLTDFFEGPGSTVLRPDELVSGVTFESPEGRARSVYSKAGQRNALAIAVASVGLVFEPEAGSIRIALGSVAPTVVRATEAEEFFESGWVGGGDRNELVREVAAAAARAACPIDDIRASAWYRTVLIEVMTRRALKETCLQG
jgi:carbon-monoxide dehydrogenase medium subunit